MLMPEMKRMLTEFGIPYTVLLHLGTLYCSMWVTWYDGVMKMDVKDVS